MKKIVSLLALLGTFGAANAQSFPVCVSFAPAGYCDGMTYTSATSADWYKWDCSQTGAQTKANYAKGKTVCKGAKGCNPSATYGWDALNWKFKFSKNTGTLTGISGGVKTVLQQDMPIAVTAGACTHLESKGGVSSLSR